MQGGKHWFHTEDMMKFLTRNKDVKIKTYITMQVAGRIIC